MCHLLESNIMCFVLVTDVGIFVDSSGQKTRDEEIQWSGLPLSFGKILTWIVTIFGKHKNTNHWSYIHPIYENQIIPVIKGMWQLFVNQIKLYLYCILRLYFAACTKRIKHKFSCIINLIPAYRAPCLYVIYYKAMQVIGPLDNTTVSWYVSIT